MGQCAPGRSAMPKHVAPRARTEAPKPSNRSWPIYRPLVHGKQNVLYMAAQTLRNLPTGQAYINYVGASGMMSALLIVPRISEHPLSAETFATLRERLLSQSAAAMPIAAATRLVEEREQRLLAARRTVEEEPEPATFRTRAPDQAAAGRARSRPAAAVRVDTRSSVNKRTGTVR